VSFIDDLAQLRSELAGDGGGGRRSPRMRGLAIGRVVNLLDPLFLGRVQVRVPSVDGLDLFPYARVIVPGGSFFSGVYWIPNIDDEVLVMFEDGDPDAAYILGGVWNAMHPPPMPSPLAQVRTIRSPLGNQVVFTDLPGATSVTLQSGPTPPVAIPSLPSPVGPFQTISLNPLGIQIVGGPTVSITCGENLVTIGPEGVSILTPATINFVAGDSVLSMSPAGIVMSGPSITLASEAAISLTAGGAAAVTAGGAVTVTGGGAVTLTAGGAATVLAGAAFTAVAGAAASVIGAGSVLLTSAVDVLKATPPSFIPKPV
jgi:hypothetical protein